jgi:hypothetical protein
MQMMTWTLIRERLVERVLEQELEDDVLRSLLASAVAFVFGMWRISLQVQRSLLCICDGVTMDWEHCRGVGRLEDPE